MIMYFNMGTEMYLCYPALNEALHIAFYFLKSNLRKLGLLF